MTKGIRYHKCYDKIIFKKIRAKFGGNLKVLICGSAPISPEISIFFQVALSIHLADVYGQTECGPVCITHPKDLTTAHSGGLFPINKLRLRDCPELEYLSTDKPYPRGEL